MLVLMLPRVSSRVSGFRLAEQCMGEAAETYLLQGVTRSSGFPLASQCLWGQLQKHVLVKVSSEVEMSFCVATVALVTFHSTLYCTLYTLHSTLYTPHFTLHTLHSTLYTPHTLRFTLHTLHFTFGESKPAVHKTEYWISLGSFASVAPPCIHSISLPSQKKHLIFTAGWLLY